MSENIEKMTDEQFVTATCEDIGSCDGMGVDPMLYRMAQVAARYGKVVAIVREMFRRGDAEGLHVGLGRNDRIAPDAQEGPLVRQLRQLLRDNA